MRRASRVGSAVASGRVPELLRYAQMIYSGGTADGAESGVGDSSGRCQRLTAIGVDFDASADQFLHVRSLRVWNGLERVAQFDDLSERGPEFTHVFDGPLELQGWTAINLSIEAEFPINIDAVTPRRPRDRI